jgi:hypothetical protein
MRTLVRGWAPTFFGYSMQGLCKFGFYEVFKILYSNMLGEVRPPHSKILFQYYLASYGISCIWNTYCSLFPGNHGFNTVASGACYVSLPIAREPMWHYNNIVLLCVDIIKNFNNEFSCNRKCRTSGVQVSTSPPQPVQNFLLTLHCVPWNR